jgi:hypothetical protein
MASLRGGAFAEREKNVILLELYFHDTVAAS